MSRILIIEDEEPILMALEDDLTLEGYDVATANDGIDGFERARQESCDLIILDIMLPRMDGFEVCKRLRQEGVLTPILMLTAKSQEVDTVLGLELGADDYVTKPFSPRELLARIKALLRRKLPSRKRLERLEFEDVEIDFREYEARKNGQPVYLTALEFNLLQFLARHRGEVKSRDDILDAVWGEDEYVMPRTVDTHIAHLRKKLERDPSKPSYIKGVRGVGYKFMG
ncbi:MAG TPA: response regulator transcription factor [Acidobacteriota bacterium]|nr:response regulator transcription factor [Acidobacteriota bacterium]